MTDKSYNNDMRQAIRLSTSKNLGRDPLIIITTATTNDLPFMKDIQTNLGSDGQLRNILAGPAMAKLGSLWNLRSAKGWDLSIISAGTKPISKIDLVKLNKSITTCVRQHSRAKLQLICHGLELEKEDRSLNGTSELHAIDSIIQGIFSADYEYDEFKSKKPLNKLKSLTLVGWEDLDPLIIRQEGLIQGINFAKDLANAPPNICTPPYLAAQGKALAKEHKKLRCKIIGEQEMRKLGMNAYLAVCQGSTHPPQLIIMEYKGGSSNTKPIVIVGKGMTFDTGGISIKPSAQMDEMKYDMSGAAAVFGALKFVAELDLPVNLVAVVAGAENSVDGKSYRPGDVIRTMSGKTVEVLNTDAEGRMVLCDTLTYVARYKPRFVLDLATLTGACIIALGHLRSGLFANDDELAARIENAGAKSQDLVWRMPMDKIYLEDMNTNFADIANVGGRAAGTITAAGFLAEFTADYPWAHLDIAGTAWIGGKEKGSTGRPVPLLAQMILDSINT